MQKWFLNVCIDSGVNETKAMPIRCYHVFSSFFFVLFGNTLRTENQVRNKWGAIFIIFFSVADSYLEPYVLRAILFQQFILRNAKPQTEYTHTHKKATNIATHDTGPKKPIKSQIHKSY